MLEIWKGNIGASCLGIKRSLLGALDTLATAVVTLLIIFITIALSAALGMRVPLLFFVFLKFASLSCLHLLVVVVLALFRASQAEVKRLNLL